MPDSIPKTYLRKNVKTNCRQTRTIAETKFKSQLKLNTNSKDWNAIHLRIKDYKMQHYVNGELFSEVNDLDKANKSSKGYIG